MSETFIMVSNGGIWNYGCEAIVRSTFRMLTDTFPQCQVECVSYSPDYDIPALSDLPVVMHPARPRKSIHRIFRKCLRMLPFSVPWYHILDINPKIFKHATCVLSVGGDIYTPRKTGLILNKLQVERVILDMGIPIALWGATVGPFESDTKDGQTIEDYLRRVSLIIARESRTMDYLKHIRVADHSIQSPDPSFILKPQEFDFELFLPRNKMDFVLGVNLSPMLNVYLPSEKDIIDVGTKCLKAVLHSLPVSVALIPHVVGSNEWNNDHLILKRIYQNIVEYNGRVSLVPKNLGARKTKYLLSKCDGVVAARMHCAIAGLSSLVPTICISYSMKSIGVLGDLYENQDWVITLNQLNANTFVERISRLLANSSDIRLHLSKKIPSIQKQVWELGDELKKTLHNLGLK